MTKSNVRYNCVEQDSFCKFMHKAASVRETCVVYKSNHSTEQLIENYNNFQATAFKYLIYKHSTFLRLKFISALPTATVL